MPGTLSPRDSVIFLEALANPPEANEALKAAFAKHFGDGAAGAAVPADKPKPTRPGAIALQEPEPVLV